MDPCKISFNLLRLSLCHTLLISARFFVLTISLSYFFFLSKRPILNTLKPPPVKEKWQRIHFCTSPDTIYSRMFSAGCFKMISFTFSLPSSLKLYKWLYSFSSSDKVPLACVNSHLMTCTLWTIYNTYGYDRLKFLTKCLFYIHLSLFLICSSSWLWGMAF